MRPRSLLTAGVCLMLTAIAPQLGAQGAPPAAPGGRGGGAAQGGRGRGQATFPAQQRELADPAVIERGRALYEINCRSCHGPDLRGGDLGGPNLLRSTVVLNDQHGELIVPIVQNGKSTPGATTVMPPLALPAGDITALAEYIHSVVFTARGQGAPPAGPEVELNIVVGDARAGQAYFTAKCSTCHSVTGDLQGIGARLADAKTLQNLWVSGASGGRGGRGGRGRGGAGAGDRPEVRVTVTDPSGSRVEGRLDRVDDFLVVLTTDAGQQRSFSRRGDVPRLEIDDPMAGHRDLLSVYTDKDIHDVTAYLVTLK